MCGYPDRSDSCEILNDVNQMRVELANLRQTVMNYENDFAKESKEKSRISQNPPPIPPRTVVTIPTPKMQSNQEKTGNFWEYRNSNTIFLTQILTQILYLLSSLDSRFGTGRIE